MSTSPVIDFYKGKNLFITGGTGFVGICLIEKLLRCTEVNKIYLLVRPKKGVDASARIEDIKKNSVFGELVTTRGTDLFSKLVIVGGDVGEENLGLSSADRQTLVDNVHVVFHSAATLDFEANLSTTVRINLQGTQRVVELCKQIKDLKALLHVSSAYVNSHMLEPEEKIYDVPKTAAEVIQLVQTGSDGEIEEKTAGILGEYINTYTFTKALAEQEVAATISSFPSAIIRPSQITASWKEPVPGWTVSKNGPQGFLMGAMKGVVRRLPVDPDIICDYIPVDVVVNGMVVAAWNAATTRPSETPIFHLTSSTSNPFQWSCVAPHMDDLFHKYPLKGAVWYPALRLHSTLFMFKLSTIIFHWIPAYILDTVTRVSGGRPILVRMHTNIGNSLERLKTFIFTQWKFTNKRTQALHDSLTTADKELFTLDVRPLSWIEYFENMGVGVRTYLHNENINNLPAAIKKDSLPIMDTTCLLPIHARMEEGKVSKITEDNCRLVTKDHCFKVLNYIIQAVFIFLVWTLLTTVTFTTYSGTIFTFLPTLVALYSLL